MEAWFERLSFGGVLDAQRTPFIRYLILQQAMLNQLGTRTIPSRACRTLWEANECFRGSRRGLFGGFCAELICRTEKLETVRDGLSWPFQAGIIHPLWHPSPTHECPLVRTAIALRA